MRHVHSKRDGAAALAVLMPMLDDVADQRFGVHAASELRNHVVSFFNPHALQVGVDWRVHARFHEIAADDQVCDLRAFDHHIEQITEPATVTSTRCCGHPEQHRVGIERDQLLTSSAASAVSFIEDQQVGRR
jgi:hypothetical protein